MTTEWVTNNEIRLDDAAARELARTLPVIGMDIKLAADGAIHPWRVALAFPGEHDRASIYLMRIPPTVYVSPPFDDIHGDLLTLPGTLLQQAEEIRGDLAQRGCDQVLMDAAMAQTSVAQLLARWGIKLCLVRIWDSENTPDRFGIGGDAGRDIAILTDPDRREYEVWYHLDGGKYEIDQHTRIN